MIERQWISVKKLEWQPVAVGKWFLALKFVTAGTMLQISSGGLWHYFDAPTVVGPDGHPRGTIPDADVPLSGMPVAAIVGKFGGSSADLAPPALPVPVTPGTGIGVFAVGRICIVPTLDGPLFLAVNLAERRLTGVKFTLWTEIFEPRA